MSNDRKVIDLFAGVGGLSLGAARAGFKVAAAVEVDPRASAYHAINFPKSKHIQEDVAGLTGQSLLAQVGLRVGQLAGLIGGPPCQGFSSIGLRSESDPRNELLIHFFRMVSETRPAFFVAENVPGLIHSRNKAVVDRALSKVPSNYIVLPPLLMQASDYGAPTKRKRVFFIGYDPDRFSKGLDNDFISAPDVNFENITVARALTGLPILRKNWLSEEQGWRRVSTGANEGEFERRLRGHVPDGVGHGPSLSRLASASEVSGFLATVHTPESEARFRRLKPGKSDPVSKCARLDPKGYCPTLRAGTGPERGSYQAIRPIHPMAPRVICPREAARLQGFPDWFQFHPTKWHSFRQIGNSVSPILSEHLMSRIISRLF